MACLFLLRESLDCAIYIDTGYGYPETATMIDFAATLIPVHRFRTDRAGQNAREGIPSDFVPIASTRLGQLITGPKPMMLQSYLGCCWDNISWPLLEKATALGVTELVYGQRTEESHKTPIRYAAAIEGMTRLHPIENWTAQQVLDYLATNMTVPDHYRIGHSSLDCYDCTGFEYESEDRLAWTAEHYPEFYASYAVRAKARDEAINQAFSERKSMVKYGIF